jgi:hypothetical protein
MIARKRTDLNDEQWQALEALKAELSAPSRAAALKYLIDRYCPVAIADLKASRGVSLGALVAPTAPQTQENPECPENLETQQEVPSAKEAIDSLLDFLQ